MLHQNVYKFLRSQNLKIGFCVLLSNTAQGFKSKVHYSATPPHSKLWNHWTSILKYTDKLSSLIKCFHAPILHL